MAISDAGSQRIGAANYQSAFGHTNAYKEEPLPPERGESGNFLLVGAEAD
jgi:hypothetical protein